MAEDETEKPEHPEHPHGGAPGQTGQHPEHPHGGPPGHDTPDDEDAPHPAHPIAEPEDETDRAATAPPAIEPRMNLDEFAGVAQLRVAEVAALRSWMRRQAHVRRGSYTLAEWQAFHQDMLGHT